MPLQAFFINLDRHPERREHMERAVAALGLEPRRVAALDARRDPAPSEYVPHRFSADRWEIGRFEQAVFASHRKVWKIIAGGDSAGIVMEDDLIFSPMFPETVKTVAAGVCEYDILRLNISMQRRLLGPVRIIGPGLAARPILESFADAGCYVVTPSAARRLLDRSAVFCEHLDDFVFFGRHGLRIYQLDPPVCGQVIHDSGMSESWKKKGVQVSERLAETSAPAKGPLPYRLFKALKRAGRQLVSATLVLLGRAERLMMTGEANRGGEK